MQASELPATYWALSLDADTAVCLLWAAGEAFIRAEGRERSIGGLKAMYEIAQRRRARVIGPNAGDAMSTWILDENYFPIRYVSYLEAPHEKRTLVKEADFSALCGDPELAAKAAAGKYSHFWKGDEKELLCYAYGAGQLVKEDWQWPPTLRQQKYIDRMRQSFPKLGAPKLRGPSADDYEEALADFRRALAL